MYIFLYFLHGHMCVWCGCMVNTEYSVWLVVSWGGYQLSPSLFVTTSSTGKLARFVTISLADLKLEARVIIRDAVSMTARSMISYYEVRVKTGLWHFTN